MRKSTDSLFRKPGRFDVSVEFLQRVRRTKGVIDAWSEDGETIYVKLQNFKVICLYGQDMDAVHQHVKDMEQIMTRSSFDVREFMKKKSLSLPHNPDLLDVSYRHSQTNSYSKVLNHYEPNENKPYLFNEGIYQTHGRLTAFSNQDRWIRRSSETLSVSTVVGIRQPNKPETDIHTQVLSANKKAEVTANTKEQQFCRDLPNQKLQSRIGSDLLKSSQDFSAQNAWRRRHSDTGSENLLINYRKTHLSNIDLGNKSAIIDKKDIRFVDILNKRRNSENLHLKTQHTGNSIHLGRGYQENPRPGGLVRHKSLGKIMEFFTFKTDRQTPDNTGQREGTGRSQLKNAKSSGFSASEFDLNRRRNSLAALPACSPNLMEYTIRRNSDTNVSNGLSLRDLKRLRDIHESSMLENKSSMLSRLFGSLSNISSLFDRDGKNSNKAEKFKSMTEKRFPLESSDLNEDEVTFLGSRQSSRQTTNSPSNTLLTVPKNRENVRPFDLIRFDSELESNEPRDGRNSDNCTQLGTGNRESSGSNIMNIFQRFVPSYLPGCDQLEKQNATTNRRRSIDSLLAFNPVEKVRGSEAGWKRFIKISPTDQSSVIFIPGAETLGGLPDVDDNSHFRAVPASRLRMTDRRMSCPVIFETEETEFSISTSGLQKRISRDSSEIATRLPEFSGAENMNNQSVEGDTFSEQSQSDTISSPSDIRDDTVKYSGEKTPSNNSDLSNNLTDSNDFEKDATVSSLSSSDNESESELRSLNSKHLNITTRGRRLLKPNLKLLESTKNGTDCNELPFYSTQSKATHVDLNQKSFTTSWEESSISVSSFAGDNESSNYFSDISSLASTE